MRASLRMCALALACALAVVAAVPPVRADMDKPTWNAGDFWAYSFNGTFDIVTIAFVPVQVNGPGTFRVDVVGPDTVAVGSVSYPSYRTRLSLNATGGVVLNTGEAWFRSSDLALVESRLNLTLNSPLGQVTVILTRTYDPPSGMHWPLAAAASWTSLSAVTTLTQVIGLPLRTVTGDVSTDYSVQGAATVTVPAGTFDTMPVRGSANGDTVTYWAPSAGNYARQQKSNPQGQQTYAAEMTAYHYAGSGFLGLPIIVWLVIILVVFLVVLGVIYTRRQRRRGVMLPLSPPRVPP